MYPPPAPRVSSAREVHSRRHDAPARSDVPNEDGLARQLSATQQATMALGGAIGTGLFLASGLSVNVAGPAILLSYLIVAGVSLLLTRALTDMAVAHPTAGAFGVYAGIYVSPFAGYAVRVSYWLMQVIATGGQLVASSIYMAYWFPDVPGAVWVLAFAVALLYVNSRAVGRLGTIEYLARDDQGGGRAGLHRAGGARARRRHRRAGGRAAAPHRPRRASCPSACSGVWLGCCFVIYSFIGVEIVAVTSGEASDPARTIPVAMRRMVFGLSAIYVVTITLLVALTPWNELGVGESPVRAGARRPRHSGRGRPHELRRAERGAVEFERQPLPDRAHAVLARPRRLRAASAWRRLSGRRAGERAARLGPRPGGGGARAGTLARLGLRVVLRSGALWRPFRVADDLRHAHRLLPRAAAGAARSSPFLVASWLGAAAIGAVLLSTWWVPGLESTLVAGGPWLALLGFGYRRQDDARRRRLSARAGSGVPWSPRWTGSVPQVRPLLTRTVATCLLTPRGRPGFAAVVGIVVAETDAGAGSGRGGCGGVCPSPVGLSSPAPANVERRPRCYPSLMLALVVAAGVHPAGGPLLRGRRPGVVPLPRVSSRRALHVVDIARVEHVVGLLPRLVGARAVVHRDLPAADDLEAIAGHDDGRVFRQADAEQVRELPDDRNQIVPPVARVDVLVDGRAPRNAKPCWWFASSVIITSGPEVSPRTR